MDRQPSTPRLLARPAPGFRLLRLVPRGWQVPALIELRNGIYTGMVDEIPLPGRWTGGELDALIADALICGELFTRPMTRLLTFGQPVSEITYRHQIAVKRWAEREAPWHPALHPNEPIDPRLYPATDF